MGSDHDLRIVRRMLAAMFLFGSLGTGAELLLLEHTEDVWQIAPIVLIAMGSATLPVLAIRPAIAGVRTFQVVMILFIASGVVGVLLHYKGNVEFEQELRPGASGVELFWEAMKGATPALAPGTMALLGALGLAYIYHHPVVRRTRENDIGISGGLR
jgi:hypothetical protein